MNKRIVVTGGTKGIGRAILEKYASEGWDIATCARTESDLIALEKDLKIKYPEITVFVQKCDVSDKQDIIDWCGALNTAWGTIDILINNAGIFLPGSVITEEEEKLIYQIETNLYSAYRFTRLLLPMIDKKRIGHIFNMCSIASIAAYPNGGAYTISKFALYGFSKCLRQDLLKSSIKVTTVMPGATWSESWKGSSFSENDMIKSEDIADLVWQCSQLSKQAVVEELIIRPQGGDL